MATIREHRVDLTATVALPGLPGNTGAIGYPITCSNDGDIYLTEVVYLDEKGDAPLPDLYRVSAGGEAKHLPRPAPTDFKQLSSPGFFAGNGVLVSVIDAYQPVDEQAAHAHPGGTTFLSLTDSAGDHPRLIRLDLSFDPYKAAAFGSGEIVVLGLDRKLYQPVVAMLNSDGQFRKYLDVFPKPEGATQDTEADSAQEKARRHALFFSIGAAQFAPWGSDVLMVAPGIDNSSVYHIRASGQVERIQIKLPNGEQVESVLGSSGKDDWVVRAISAESAKLMSGAHIVENPQEFFYEVNPRSGEILGKLVVAGPQPGEVVCAANGRLSAIFVGDSDKLVLASAPR
jgi:hypothetical protein